MRNGRLMFKHSSGWCAWAERDQVAHLEDQDSDSFGSEEGGESDQMTPDDGEAYKEEEEITDPTVPGEEAGDRDGAGVSSSGGSQGRESINDSLPGYIVLKHSKAQLKKEIFMTLGLRFNPSEMQEFMKLFPMQEMTARRFVADMALQLKQFRSQLSHAI
jgi:hypothetical protein